MIIFYVFSLVILLFVGPLTSAFDVVKNDKYIYPKLHLFDQKLDHFNPTIDATFQQRFFVSDQYYDGEGPIFFYTGNEGAIETFMNNTGFMWDIAPPFRALVVFAEHRFYGKTKPFGDIEPTPSTIVKFGQFTVEQALADYAVLIQHIRGTMAKLDSPVIVFGGSYGGMLSAWLRIKYAHIVDGAIAASAPVRYFTGHVECNAYNHVVKKVFESVDHGVACSENIANIWKTLNHYGQSESGLKTLSEIFHTCKPLHTSDAVSGWLQDTLGTVVMVDYPYENNFISPLPAWPVNATCQPLSTPDLQDKQLLQAMSDAMQVYYNHTGQTHCFNVDASSTASLGAGLWAVQTCTEMVMPFCSNGETDFFPPSKWSLENFTAGCQKSFGVTPRPHWAILNFGGSDLKAASNIVFSNGALDPWHVGGILTTISDSVIALYISEAAHHLDLRHSNPKDPQSVIKTREVEVMHINRWIKEAMVKRKN